MPSRWGSQAPFINFTFDWTVPEDMMRRPVIVGGVERVEEFFERLEYLMKVARDSMEIKRKVIERKLKRGLMPYSREYLESFDTFFSTIGLVGMNEACLNLLGMSIAEPEGKALAIKVLKFMREKLSEFQEQTGHLYNLEATPAEGASYRLAKGYKDVPFALGIRRVSLS